MDSSNAPHLDTTASDLSPDLRPATNPSWTDTNPSRVLTISSKYLRNTDATVLQYNVVFEVE